MRRTTDADASKLMGPQHVLRSSSPAEVGGRPLAYEPMEEGVLDRRGFLARPAGMAAALLAMNVVPGLIFGADASNAATSGFRDGQARKARGGSPAGSVIPPDDPARRLTIRRADDPKAVHVSVAGGTYTLLVTGAETGGRYCLIDMHVPSGAGPPAHRHDFEEMFTITEGEVEFTFRDARLTARAGETVNIPANAPHAFKNTSGKAARLLCLCTPAGQDDFFLAVGDRVASRTAPPPALSEAEKGARAAKAEALAPHYRTELLASQ